MTDTARHDHSGKLPAHALIGLVGLEVSSSPTSDAPNGKMSIREVAVRNVIVAADGHHLTMEVQGIDADGQPTWTTRSLQISALGVDHCAIHFEAHLRCGPSTGGKPLTALFGGCQAWVRADSDIDQAKESLKARVKAALQTMSGQTASAEILRPLAPATESNWQLWGCDQETGKEWLLTTGEREDICARAVLADNYGRDVWVIAPDHTKHLPDALRAAVDGRDTPADTDLPQAEESLKARIQATPQTIGCQRASADILKQLAPATESGWQLWGCDQETGKDWLVRTGQREDICSGAVLADDCGRDAWVIAPDGTRHLPDALRAAADERQAASDSERGRDRHTG